MGGIAVSGQEVESVSDGMPVTPARVEMRRYDLDWLRIGAFAVLIFYHIAFYYVTWEWLVKSRYASTAMEPVLGLVSSLATLFFISGVSVRYMSDRMKWSSFVMQRSTRLFMPLAFGALVLNVPQSYVGLRVFGDIEPGYLEFHRDYLGFGRYAFSLPELHHLWYVGAVLAYTLLVAMTLPILRSVTQNAANPFFEWLDRGRAWRILLVPALPFILYVAVLEIYLSNLGMGWWAGTFRTVSFFLLGFMAAKNENFWNAVDKALPWSIILSVALGGVSLVAWLHQSETGSDTRLLYGALLLRPLYSWSMLVTLFGLARRFANQPSRALAYLTAAVFPYFILHQTIIIVVGYWCTLHEVPLIVEVAAISMATLAGCALSYELIRRSGPIRLLFGLPLREKKASGLGQGTNLTL